MILPCLRQTDKGVEIRVFVQPRASRNQVVGLHGDELKVKLTAPPVEGAANKECSVFLGKLCSLPRSRVTLVSGESSRHKRLLLADTSAETIDKLLQELLGA